MSDFYYVTATGKNTATLLSADNRQPVVAFFSRRLKPICGDKVLLEQLKSEFRIVEIMPRLNTFARADKNGRKQNIAANLEQMMIVLAVKPEPTQDILNRYLVAAHSQNLEPLLVFNKTDLSSSFFINTANQYQKLGYQTFSTTINQPTTVEPLKSVLHDKTTLIVGQSGVGKSSLTKMMMPQIELKVGQLSTKTGKGSHTTSVTQMYYDSALNARIIDSPGVWEYGLWQMSSHQLAAAFVDFEPFIGCCKFSNCSHSHEPGCAIQDAVKKQQIEPRRYQSYLRIMHAMQGAKR